jgi:hypothetical protein
MASDGRRVTTTSFSGTFTVFFSTRAAWKAGTPTRWADGYLPAVGRRWPGKKIDLRKFSALNLAGRNAPA